MNLKADKALTISVIVLTVSGVVTEILFPVWSFVMSMGSEFFSTFSEFSAGPVPFAFSVAIVILAAVGALVPRSASYRRAMLAAIIVGAVATFLLGGLVIADALAHDMIFWYYLQQLGYWLLRLGFLLAAWLSLAATPQLEDYEAAWGGTPLASEPQSTDAAAHGHQPVSQASAAAGLQWNRAGDAATGADGRSMPQQSSAPAQRWQPAQGAAQAQVNQAQQWQGQQAQNPQQGQRAQQGPSVQQGQNAAWGERWTGGSTSPAAQGEVHLRYPANQPGQSNQNQPGQPGQQSGERRTPPDWSPAS